MSDARSGEHRHHQPQDHEHDRGTSIGLDEHQSGRQRGDDQREQEHAELLQPVAIVGEKLGEADDCHQLANLRCLDHGESEIEPTSGAELLAAKKEHRDQHDDPESVGEPAQRVDQSVVEPSESDHQHGAHESEDDVSLDGAGEDDAFGPAGQ